MVIYEAVSISIRYNDLQTRIHRAYEEKKMVSFGWLVCLFVCFVYFLIVLSVEFAVYSYSIFIFL